MSANLDDFLPSIFRPRKLPLSGDIPTGEQGNILAPGPVLRGDAPASVTTTNAGTTPNISAPVDPTAEMVGQDTGGTGTTRDRRVETDDQGRPLPNKTMSGDQQQVDYNQRVHNYIPQESHGWWNKWGKQMVTGALKGLAYGPGGAIFGAANSGIRAATNPEQADEQWKAEAIAESDPEVKRIAQNEALKTKMAQEAAQTANTQANTALAQGRLKDLGKPKPGAIHHDVNAAGNMVIVDDKGLSTEVHDAQGNPVKKISNDEDLVPDKTNPNILHKTKGGKDTGISYVVDPQYGNVPSGAAANAGATAGNIARTAQDKAREAQQKNANADRNIQDIERRQGLMGTAPPQTITKTTALGESEQVPNKAYEDWHTQWNSLEAEKRRWSADKVSVPSVPISRSVLAPTPETHQLVKSEWLKTHDVADWPKAVAAAKAAKYSILQ